MAWYVDGLEIEHVPTSSGSQFAHRAQERMMSRKPTARTKESKITAIGF
jgi:hypothetical protein